MTLGWGLFLIVTFVSGLIATLIEEVGEEAFCEVCGVGLIDDEIKRCCLCNNGGEK